mmetsp:Transcript_9665/g.11005  ORF Transcript_9665/g.11005 Transcript_9665/m.11005 type:complete len:119 (+) Transcript_9665:131-487(+)
MISYTGFPMSKYTESTVGVCLKKALAEVCEGNDEEEKALSEEVWKVFGDIFPKALSFIADKQEAETVFNSEEPGKATLTASVNNLRVLNNHIKARLEDVSFSSSEHGVIKTPTARIET